MEILEVNRFDIFLASFDPSIGSEINKTRPCLIISPNEMNRHLRTVIVAPITSTIKEYSTRIIFECSNVKGSIVIDQLRTIDRRRLIKKLDVLNDMTKHIVVTTLTELFLF